VINKEINKTDALIAYFMQLCRFSVAVTDVEVKAGVFVSETDIALLYGY